MKEYPYIQEKKVITNSVCQVCKKKKDVVHQIEWRVDWFQGNCEFETICPDCLNKRNQEEKRQEEAYIKKMTPIWEKQRNNQERKERYLEEEIKKLGLGIIKYDNGQWAIGGVIDWWTSTGTAIERKSRIRHNFSFSNPKEIIRVLNSFNQNT